MAVFPLNDARGSLRPPQSLRLSHVQLTAEAVEAIAQLCGPSLTDLELDPADWTAADSSASRQPVRTLRRIPRLARWDVTLLARTSPRRVTPLAADMVVPRSARAAVRCAAPPSSGMSAATDPLAGLHGAPVDRPLHRSTLCLLTPADSC